MNHRKADKTPNIPRYDALIKLRDRIEEQMLGEDKEMRGELSKLLAKVKTEIAYEGNIIRRYASASVV